MLTKPSNLENFLIVPGLYDSDVDHWQSRWQERFNLSRVVQPDWTSHDIDLWAQTVERSVRELPAPVVILAHSFGCLATVFAATQLSDKIAAALLVAPADPDSFDFQERMPRSALPFPSIVVASRNDPWLLIEKAAVWANRWQSDFVDLGRSGHINYAAGFRHWPEGWELARSLAGSRRRLRLAKPRSAARTAFAARDGASATTRDEQSYVE